MGAQKLIHTEFLHTQGVQKSIHAIFSTLLRTKGAQKLVRAEFSTNKVVPVQIRVQTTFWTHTCPLK